MSQRAGDSTGAAVGVCSWKYSVGLGPSVLIAGGGVGREAGEAASSVASGAGGSGAHFSKTSCCMAVILSSKA